MALAFQGGPKATESAVIPMTGFLGLSSGHQFQHMSKKCVAEMHKLETEERAAGKKNFSKSHDHECKTTMKCKYTMAFKGQEMKSAKCFPKDACNPDNIEKELREKLPEGVKFTFSCDE